MSSSSLSSLDPKSGFNSKTRTFHSLHSSISLPKNPSLSFPSFAFSLLSSSSNFAIADSSTALSLSSSQFLSQVNSLSFSLKTQLNLSIGSVAFILSPPHLHVPILYFSLLQIGAIISPSNPSSTPREISRQIQLINPSIAFVTSSTASNLPTNVPKILIDTPHFVSLLNPDKKVGSFPTRYDDIQQSDTAAILFSSGTTGHVKGVILTHMNLIAATLASSAASGPVTIMITVPLFHVFGLLCLVKAVARGERVVIMTGRFEARQVLRAVEMFRVTNLVLVPPALLRIVREEDEEGNWGEADLSSLVVVSSGGASVGMGVIRRFLKRFPNVRVGQGYGLTESTAGVFRVASPEECRHLGSAGRLLPGCEAKIVDPSTGIALHPCKQGELWVRGPTIMKGYIGDEEATSAILDAEGWLKTGDLCYIDDDGYLFVVDRLKELIKYKGYQVPPAELEHLVQMHDDVIEAAVIPYPDDEAGQVPMVFVVRKLNSSVGEAEIMEFVAKRVAPYMKIRRVSFVNSIPKNPAGKILRKELIKLSTTNINPKL